MRDILTTLRFIIGKFVSSRRRLPDAPEKCDGDLRFVSSLDNGEEQQFRALCRADFPEGAEEKSLDDPSRRFFFLLRNGRLTGFALFRPHFDLCTLRAHPLLMQIYVVPEERGRGHAQKLLVHAIAHLPRTELFLFVDERANVKKLYEAMGFKACGRLLWRSHLIAMSRAP